MAPNPTELPHQLDRDKCTCRAIIETPAGSRAKISFDPESGLYRVGKLMPIGLAMPLDFGFIPSTCGGDGDPLDVMVLNEAGLPTGCLATVRLIGAIEVEQAMRDSGGASERNDRLVARLADSRRWRHVDRLDQLGEAFLGELNRFFEHYKDLKGQTYEVLATGGPERASELIDRWAKPRGS